MAYGLKASSCDPLSQGAVQKINKMFLIYKGATSITEETY